jgi:hypothetical protein
MHFTQIDKPQKQNKKFLASDDTLTEWLFDPTTTAIPPSPQPNPK